MQVRETRNDFGRGHFSILGAVGLRVGTSEPFDESRIWPLPTLLALRI